jgi:simple sugar transport system permease protein
VVGALIIQTLTTTILARGVARPATLVVKAFVVILISLAQSPSFRARIFRKRGRGQGRKEVQA